MKRAPILRVARPTDDLATLRRMYVEGLSLEELGSFEDHAGFDGVMLGREGWPYHLEFTAKRGHSAEGRPSADDLLVFYLPDADDWRAACARMERAGFQPVPAFNPYWDRDGRTFLDPDGYRVVLQRAAWGD